MFYTTMNKETTIITGALPYANGPIHLGHLLEYIQADIFARSQKQKGSKVLYLCADDAHGSAIMLKAKEQKISPQELVDKIKQEHQNDLESFLIDFDNYHTTQSFENQELVTQIYKSLQQDKSIFEKKIKQYFDENEKMFLPDRFIKGQCPKCQAQDQYGDNCEVCGQIYLPTELINPISVLSKTTPVLKETEHLFFDLPKFAKSLASWMEDNSLQKEVRNKLKEWFEVGLKPWNISRDAPYFGIKIPDKKDKYFYVWLDAPIGYFASLKNLAKKDKTINFENILTGKEKTKLYHFIGKDIIYFHCLFWPAILKSANLKTPDGVFAHGYISINGQKMSKSKGTFIKASDYLQHLEPEYLRYYYASKLTNKIDDIDFNLEDFTQKINSDLVGKLVNIASRCAPFLEKKFDNTLASDLEKDLIYKELTTLENRIFELYEQREYAKAMREIMAKTDLVNAYINENKPWILAKSQNQSDLLKLHLVVSLAINYFYLFMKYLTPVLPNLSKKAQEFLNLKNLNQDNLSLHKINNYVPLLQRLKLKDVQKILQDETKTKENSKEKIEQKNENKQFATIADLEKIDLRIGEIISANDIKESKKLLHLKVKLTDKDIRNVFAGIKGKYISKNLIGKKILVVANLQPRKMKFGISEAMLFCAGNKEELYLLSPDDGATINMKVS